MTQTARKPKADLIATAAKLAAAPGATIATFLKGLTEVASTGRTTKVTLPKPVVPTDATRAALSGLARLASKVTWPTERRLLTAAEETAISELLAEAKAAKVLPAEIEAASRAALFNHLDVKAEQAGLADPATTPKDGSGFYLLAGSGPGYAREYAAPTPGADAGKLLEQVEAGALDKADYLAVTVPTRVVDEAKLMKFIARKPHLLPVLRLAIGYTRPATVKLKAK